MPPPVHYQHLFEGEGGVFDLRDDRTKRYPHVGTKDQNTCVGVYFPVDEHRLFCAHIVVWFNLSDVSPPVEKDGLWSFNVLNYTEAEGIKQEVRDRFALSMRLHNWSRDEARLAVREKGNVVIVCPHLTGPNASVGGRVEGPRRGSCTKTGRPVVQAIEELLDIQDVTVYQDHGAFVVDGRSGSVSHMPSRECPKGQNIELFCYETNTRFLAEQPQGFALETDCWSVDLWNIELRRS